MYWSEKEPIIQSLGVIANIHSLSNLEPAYPGGKWDIHFSHVFDVI